MVRLAILLVLLCLTIWEWRSGVRKAVYWLALIGLFIFFSLRYGQGTDYLTYLNIYANVKPLYQFPSYAAYMYNNVEIGYFYLMSFFRMFGMHFSVFVAIVTAFSLFCIHRFIKRFSPLPVFALTIFFAIYSLIYMESALRQLLALSLAMGFVFIDWQNGHKVRAMIVSASAVLMHTSAIVLFLLPILFWNPRKLFLIEWKLKTTVIVGVLVLAAAAVINFIDLTPIIRILPGRIEHTILSYYQNEKTQISLLAFGNRSLFMLTVFYLTFRARDELSDGERFLYNLYCVGYGIYFLLLSFDLIASRTSVFFRIVDITLLPALFYRNRDFVKRTVVALPALLVLMSFLYVKDITTTMAYAQYYDRNPLNYPYITVFNGDKVLDSRFVNVKNAQGMNAYTTGGQSWDEYYDSLQRKPNVRSPIVPY